MNFKRRKGFTLIELLVVIAILSLLATLTIVVLSNTRAQSRDAKRITDLRQITKALELFYDNYNRYPVTASASTWDGHWMEFQTCLETGVGCGFTISDYSSSMKEVPQDPLDIDVESENAGGITYYYSYNDSANTQGYILRVQLEDSNNKALEFDADGAYFQNNDALCEDPWYCIKNNWKY